MAGRALLAAFGALLLLSICHAETENDTCNADQPESCAAKPAATSRFSWLTKLSLGANSVPIRYMLDMSILQKPGASWLNIFCDGQARGCTRKLDWPGPQTYSQIGWETVRELGSQMPRNEWSGKWWRGNELGTVINNPFYYYSEDSTNRSRLSPLAIALGISPKQHAAIRPIFNRAFDIRGDNFEKAKEYVMKTAKELLEKRTAEGTLTHTDLKVWFHKVVNKITFDREVDDEYCLRFTTVQGKFLSTQLLSQLLPKRMYGVDPMKMTQTRKDVIEYVDEYKTLLQEQYADLLEGQDCSPSVSCVDQAAFGVFDAFVAAGGVSVPGTILQSLSVVFSTDPTNPAGKPVTYAAEEALQLHWEAIRMFPPVVVFPYWNPRPQCEGLSAAETSALSAAKGETAPCPLGSPHKHTGFPVVNQYKGGMRWLPNIAMAQLDPDKWGDDATKFKLRPLDLYHKYSLGFAEMAVDEKVAAGRMNRNCPGKALSLLMGKTFLEMFRPSEWTVDPEKPIKIKTGGPYVGDFTMYRKESIEKCREEVCKCGEKGVFQWITCKRCVKNNCYK